MTDLFVPGSVDLLDVPAFCSVREFVTDLFVPGAVDLLDVPVLCSVREFVTDLFVPVLADRRVVLLPLPTDSLVLFD